MKTPGSSEGVPDTANFFSQNHAAELRRVQAQGLLSLHRIIALTSEAGDNLPAGATKQAFGFILESDSGRPVWKTLAMLIHTVNIETDFLIHTVFLHLFL
jgi:hypothetical protein